MKRLDPDEKTTDIIFLSEAETQVKKAFYHLNENTVTTLKIIVQ